jgi:hypothetical protein
MLKLKMVCGACPEAYDAVDEAGNTVGYLRLRHGTFSVECPDSGGATVYEAFPRGDGVFDSSERDYYLRWAVKSIEDWIANGKPSASELPPAPDVEFELEDFENYSDGWDFSQSDA